MMRSDKYNRMIAAYDGFRGPQTVSHILSTIPIDLLAKITGKQAGQIMSIRNAAYHEGRASQKLDTWAYDAPTEWMAGVNDQHIKITCTDTDVIIVKINEDQSETTIKKYAAII